MCKNLFSKRKKDFENKAGEQRTMDSLARVDFAARRKVNENDEFSLEMYPEKFLPHCS